MANTTKQERVEQQFVSTLVAEQKYKSSGLRKSFEQCWNQVPSGLISKLNSKELLDYIIRHIVPKTNIPLINEPKGKYESIVSDNRKGFERFA